MTRRSLGTIAALATLAAPSLALPYSAVPALTLPGLGSIGLAAQESLPVFGRVIDGDRGDILTGVEIRLDSVSVTLTDDEGRFVLREVAPGSHQLEFRRLGFAHASSEIDVVEGAGALYLRVEMHAEPIELDPIQVQVIPRRDFVQAGEIRNRIRRGHGRFVTATAIERQGYPRTPAVIRNIPGVRMLNSNLPVFRDAYSPSSGYCAPAFYLDGMLMYDGFPEIRTIPSDQIELIEAYPGAASLPSMFAGMDSRCGVIVVWTRRGTPLSEIVDFSELHRGGG